MIIKSNNIHLFDECKKAVLCLGKDSLTSGQFRKDNKIINYWFTEPIECLVLDENENVIDGFIKFQRSFMWKDKSFKEHLELIGK